MAGDLHPRAGDTVLFCAHAGDAPSHWWKTQIGFRRPNGSSGEGQWVAACDKCFARSGGDPMNVDIAGDGVWQEEDEPIVFEKKS